MEISQLPSVPVVNGRHCYGILVYAMSQPKACRCTCSKCIGKRTCKCIAIIRRTQHWFSGLDCEHKYSHNIVVKVYLAYYLSNVDGGRDYLYRIHRHPRANCLRRDLSDSLDDYPACLRINICNPRLPHKLYSIKIWHASIRSVRMSNFVYCTCQ